MVAKEWTTKAGLLAVVADADDYYCGYVRLPDDHPLIGVAYHEQSPKLPSLPGSVKTDKRGILPVFRWALQDSNKPPAPDVYFNVHGSLTFSGKIRGYEGFWYGFDCNHLNDNKDLCDLPYCTAECESLAEQLVAFTPAEGEPRQPTTEL